MKRSWQVVAGVLGLGLIGLAVYLWLQETPEPVAAPPAPVAAPQPVTSAAPPQVAAAASAPTIQYPIEAIPAEQAPAPAPLDVQASLTELFGRKAVLSMFQLGDFPRRFVATVDNLGRSQAPASLWPVNPVGGRFLVDKRDGVDVVSPDNGLRYTPYVLLLETVELRRVAAVYRQLYPLLQKAYEDIGFPNRYFNDRFVEVIDQLLATPELGGPLVVRLPTINGPLQPERPWVLYEFEDPALQRLSAGQKIMLRVGLVNERRLKVRLAELRRLIAAGDLPR